MKKYHLKNKKSQKRKNYRGGENEKVEFKQCTPPVIYRKREEKPKNYKAKETDEFNSKRRKGFSDFGERKTFFYTDGNVLERKEEEKEFEYFGINVYSNTKISKHKIETDQPGEEKPPRKGEKT